MDEKSVTKALTELRKIIKKRKFSQTIDLIVAFKDIDMAKVPKLEQYVRLPSGLGKDMKICALIGNESKDGAKDADRIILSSNFDKFKEKKDIKKLAEEKGVTTVNNFFDETIAKDILQNWGEAKIITSTNVFAHVHKLDSLMNGIKLLLDDEGSFISENHYLKDLIEKLEYDTIYHEHLRYYGLAQLVTLFEKYDMEVYHVERIPTHGGSIRVFACQKDTHEITPSVASLLMEEKEMGLTSKQTLLDFAERVHENKSELLSLLKKLQSEGKKVVGISAPARSCTILNFCNIDSSLLSYITESSSLKIGKYTPGMNIPIKSDSFLNDEQPDYALLLSWHLKDSIVPKLRQNGFKGKFIIPLPKPIIL